MTEETKGFGLPARPLDYGDQRRNLPPFDERVKVCERFHGQIAEILAAHGIPVIESAYRAKTDERIHAKFVRRLRVNQMLPVTDIYGARFILCAQDIQRAVSTIIESFPPENRFPYKLPNIQDFTNPNTSRTYYSDPAYQAIHVLVAFGETEVPNIGEVKLMTPEQLEMDKKTRKQYENRQVGKQ